MAERAPEFYQLLTAAKANGVPFDGIGRFSFRGFRGACRVDLEAGGATASRQFQLTRDSAPEFTVVLDFK
jgi:hypothetical protein